MGRTVDVYGPKTTISIAQIASAIMYALIWSSQSVQMLWIAASFSFFQHAMLCCSAAIVTLTGDEKRAVALGRLGLSYGVGMALGSPLGGMVSKSFDLDYSFALAAFLSLAAAVINVALLPTLQPKLVQSSSTNTFNPLDIFRAATSNSRVFNLLAVSLIVSIGTSSFRAMFSMAAVEEFQLDGRDLGFYMSFSAVVGLLTNVFLIRYVVDAFTEPVALVMSIFVQSFMFLALSLASGKWALWVVGVPQTVASTIFYTLSSSQMSGAASPGDEGTVISLSHAVRSATQIVAPVIGGFLMRRFKFLGVAVFASFMVVVAGLAAAYLLLIKASRREMHFDFPSPTPVVKMSPMSKKSPRVEKKSPRVEKNSPRVKENRLRVRDSTKKRYRSKSADGTTPRVKMA